MSKPPFFAQKFIRLLTKTASALELGPSVCWMLSVIVSQEDAKRYSEPAKWYYPQLMPLCGFNSPKQLRAAIQTAVDLGWLEYTAGRKGKPCYFSVCIPEKFQEVDPSGCDESSLFTSESEANAETNSTDSLPIRTPKGERKRKRKGHASIPSTNPIKSTTPTLEEIRSFAKERKSQIDPERFFDFYQSKGWRVGKSPMTDWRAAFRNWERSDSKNPGQHPNATQTAVGQPIARVMPETKVGGYKVSPKQRRAPA